MISVEEAKSILKQGIPLPQITKLPLLGALGRVLAESVHSPIDMPSFPQSAMDGYALAYSSYQAGVPLLIAHSIQAGSRELPELQAGEAARIFTGAPVPPGADTVVMQEKVAVQGQELYILDQELRAGANVRPQASQTAKGALAISRGTRLNAGALGFIASLGIAQVPVFAAPRIGILLTGRELAPLGEPLKGGQVYESNSTSLRAALAEGHLSPSLLRQVDDDAEQTYRAVAEALEQCELLLVTGGISVGDYDFVHQSLQRAGVETLFYKIRQKPGKPLYCGLKGNRLVFGLPGNPASVMNCFYQYVVPALRQMLGLLFEIPQTSLPLAEDFTKKEGLTHFIKGISTEAGVAIHRAQESYKMDAFVESDCLIAFEEQRTHFAKGEMVKVYPLKEVWQ